LKYALALDDVADRLKFAAAVRTAKVHSRSKECQDSQCALGDEQRVSLRCLLFNLHLYQTVANCGGKPLQWGDAS
jgi:hypothetical protein